MADLTSFRAVIDLWPSRLSMQQDVEARRRKARADIRTWHHRDVIPVRWFDAVIGAAKARGFEGVTFALLTELAKAKRSQVQPEEAI